MHHDTSRMYTRFIKLLHAPFIFLVRARRGSKTKAQTTQLKKLRFKGGVILVICGLIFVTDLSRTGVKYVDLIMSVSSPHFQCLFLHKLLRTHISYIFFALRHGNWNVLIGKRAFSASRYSWKDSFFRCKIFVNRKFRFKVIKNNLGNRPFRITGIGSCSDFCEFANRKLNFANSSSTYSWKTNSFGFLEEERFQTPASFSIWISFSRSQKMYLEKELCQIPGKRDFSALAVLSIGNAFFLS